MLLGLAGIAAAVLAGAAQLRRERRRILARFDTAYDVGPGDEAARSTLGGAAPGQAHGWPLPIRWVGAWLTAGRRDRALERALPDALDDIAGAARSGSSLAGAVAGAAHNASGVLADDLAAIHASVERGASLADALERWSVQRPLPPVCLAVAGLQLAADVGGAQAGALEDVAATVRDRIAVRDDLRAASSQARASAIVLAVAPIGFAAFSGLVDPRTLAQTLGRPAGAVCLLVGVALDVAGGWWMLRLSGAGT